MGRTLDDVDKQILRRLQVDGRVSNTDLAASVHLSQAPCLRRVQRLQDEGYISGYSAQVDGEAVGRGLMVLIGVTLVSHTASNVERFESEVVKEPAVLECHWIAGETDYLLKVVVADLHGLDRLLLERLTQLPSVARVSSSIVIRHVKHTTMLPID